MNNDIICPHCDYEFENSEQFNFSGYSDYNEVIDIQCPDCDETFECEKIIKYKTYIAYEEGNG